MLLLPIGVMATFQIPSDRSITWTGNAGVNGGIPIRTTICQTITASSGDRTAEIQTAINNCPSGQVVLLGAGTFNISGLQMKTDVTLRGSGMGSTIIVPSGSEFIHFGAYGVDYGTAVGLSSGLTKGSTSITTSGNHGWNVGDCIVIDQLNNAAGDPPVTNVGEGGSMTMSGRTGDGTRAIQQVVKLVAPTSGTTATLEIPLYWTMDGTKTPQAAKVTMQVTNAGIEDLTFNSSYFYNVTIFNADNCWLKGVELNGFSESGMGIYLTNAYRIQIEKCNFHQVVAGTANDNYAITSAMTGSAHLIQNNTIHNVSCGVVIQGGFSGGVIAYNYLTNIWQEVYPTANRYAIGLHGGHQFQNLFEGNVIEGALFSSDNYWGSNSNNTLFRNRIHMDYTKVDQLVTLGVSNNQTYYNVIGNYLGTAGQDDAYETTTIPYAPSSKYIYFTPSGACKTTMLRHGNWDAVTAGQKWCDSSGEPGCQGATVDHSLPDSLYYDSKPAFFGSIAWPPINPETPFVADIPAKVYYDTGSWPDTGGDDTTPPNVPSGLSVE
jgi:hypothetical protein